MWKNILSASLLLCLSAGLVSGQSESSYYNTNAIVVLLPYKASSPLPVTDSLGSFTFFVKEQNKKPAASLWELDTISGKWVRSSNPKLLPTAVYGRTDLTAVREHSLIQSFYWKDVAGNYWCLSPVKNDFTPVAVLNAMWAGKAVAPSENAAQKTVWRTVSAVSIEYN